MVAHEKIKAAVAIIIGPGAPVALARIPNAGRFADFFETDLSCGRRHRKCPKSDQE
jgi:hypothetical protein